MRSEILLPSGPGTHAEWPTLVGAPTPWEAVRDLDGKYIASAVAGQRHSFPVTLPVPAIANDETLVSAIYRASLATVAADASQLLEPGFEESPTTWVLGTTCAVGTAEIQGIIVRSGTQALGITRVTIGGIQRCGYAERLITGLTPGRSYKVKLWHRTSALSGFVTFIMQINGVIKGVSSVLSLEWLPFISSTFSVAATSAMLRLWVQGTASTLSNTRYFDDLELVPADPDSDAVVTPFYRLYGTDTDLAPWTVPIGQTAFLAQEDRPIALYGYQLRDGGLELGVRNQNGTEARLDQAKLDVSLRFARDSMGFVGGR